ncbi:MAG TPA: GtrA family protein [Candidatus Binatia bacterium]|nr:GtrA family protein [Candidatus Binatia bacterium]
MAGRAFMIPPRATALLRRTGVRQLVKFCLVGVTSTVIDKGVLWLLLNDLAPSVPWWASATFSFALAVTNGFVWNRLWTFRARAHGSAGGQYSRFFAVNLVGLVLNLGLTKAFLVVFTGRLLHLEGNPDARTVVIASLSAVPFVTLWNFGASKYWTFRRPAAVPRRGQPGGSPRRAAAHEAGVQPSTRTRR